MKFKKQIVKPGKYVVNVPRKQKDGTVKFERDTHEITPERIKSWKDKFDAMIQDGLRIPAPFRHDLSALPLTDEQKLELEQKQKDQGSLNNAGYWDSLNIAEDGTLEGEIDVAEQALADRFGNSFKECSLMALPEFTDGKGKKWEDAILHVAVVTNPIVHGLDNFKPVTPVESTENAIALCLSALEGVALGDDDKPKLQDLSLNENLVTGEVYFSGRFKKSPQTIDLLEKFKGYVQSLEKGENVYLNSSLALALEQPEAVASLKKQDGTLLSVGDVVTLLPKVGVTLPQDTNDENFMDRLLTALTTVAAGKDGANPTVGNGLTIMPGGVQMSHKIEPDSPQGKLVAKQQRERIKGRIEALVMSGRITAPYVEEVLKPQLEGCALSLSIDDDGNLGPTGLDPVLDALERLPASIAANGAKTKTQDGGNTKIGALALSLGENPDDENVVNDEKGAEIADLVLANVGYRKTAAAAK